MIRTLCLALPMLFLAQVASAQVRIGPDGDLYAALLALGPGDELILEDGMYSLGPKYEFTANGTAAEPIVIRAADGASPHLNRPNASQNIWDFHGSYLTIRGLTFSGGSAGLRVEGGNDITIEDCEIFGTEDVALRMNNSGETYERMRILRNHIHDTDGTGEGMYLGCNNDACRLANSLIEGNYVHHTNQPGITQGDGIELKDGSYGTTIRDNVIHDTNYPCILGYSTSGNGARNIVEGNVMWNCGDNAIQWEADAILRNNIILGAGGSGVASQPHQEMGPSNLDIVHNTIINTGDALAIRGSSGSVIVANNALYSRDGRAMYVGGDSSMLTFESNAGLGPVQGIDGVLMASDMRTDLQSGTFAGTVPQSVYPTATGALAGTGDLGFLTEVDFDGVPRGTTADIGAYAVGRTGPSWEISEGFKSSETPSTPGEDGGMMDAGAGADAGDAGGPMADAGTGSDAGASMDAAMGDAGMGDAGSRADSGPGSMSPPETADGGCSVGTGSSPFAATLAALTLLAIGRRRR